MSLRVKTLAVIATIIVLMIVGTLFTIKAILLDGFAALEQQAMLRSTEQALRMIDDEIGQIASVIGDWAPWDDTYQFIVDVNRDYIENNLDDTTILNLPIDFLVFVNTNARVVYCKYVDPATAEGADCPASLTAYIEQSPLLSGRIDGVDTVKGIDILPEAPVFLAAGPILTSRFEGPAHGMLIAGRFIDDLEVDRLAQKINLSIKLERFDADRLPPNFAVARPFLNPRNMIKVVEFDEQTIGSFALLNDLQGRPILMLGIDERRQVMAQGRRSLYYVITVIVVTGVLMILALLLFLERTVLSRIAGLNAEVREIGASTDLTRKITVNGSDEIAGLSCRINEMIDAVRESTERDRAILESIEDGYFELDINGCLTFYNDSLSRLYSKSKHEMLGVSYRRFLQREAAVRAIAAFKKLYETGQPVRNLETAFVTGAGEQKFLESTVTAIRDGTDRIVGFRGITRDVTEKKEAAERLVYMVYHDSLTGLLNRKAFYTDLAQEISYADRYRQQRALLFIDLDEFKKVNDTYGHPAGDQLLCTFAARLKDMVRTTDRTYRLGGDEFAVILSNPDDQAPERVAQRIIDMMREPFIFDDAQIDFVTTSIGISIFPLNGKEVEEILQAADTRMYEAKKQKNAYYPLPHE